MDHKTLATFAWLIPAFPLISFFAILLFTRGKNRLSHTIAIGAMLISFLLAQFIFWSVISDGEALAASPIAQAIPWLPIGATTLNMGVMIDPLTAIMLFMVPLTCLMIFIYSVGYSNFNKPRDVRDEPGKAPEYGVEPLYSRFFAFLSLFAAGMLTLVVTDNLLMLFIGWEIMGLCSYLLIGFWYARNYSDPKKITPRSAAVKAFMTTRVGDVFMMLGIVFLYYSTGSLSFHDIFTAEKTHALATALFLGIPAAQVIFGLLFIGTVGKSAQFPLHVWLPDAMEGPTPVSAMIHAAAMVSAGVYMVIRMFPLLAGTVEAGSPTFGVMAAIGGFNALFAATIALAQNDIKKVLAYSTISQLGYMIAALGIGAWVAAAFHLITHAFFKALLFMGSGSVIHGVEHGHHAVHEAHATSAHAEQFLAPDHAAPADAQAGHSHEEHSGPEFDPQDMFNMGGLRKMMPWTFWTFLIGGFALSGFPLITAGFWSKDEILGEAFTQNPIVFWVLALSALLTAFYTMRQISLSFLGQPRTEAANHAHESHWTMILPLVILAFFAITAGFVGVKAGFPGLGSMITPVGQGAEFSATSPFERFIEPTISAVIHIERGP